MANDASSKSTSSSNENTLSSSATDQQKVPPLRIVLNSTNNQKSSSVCSTSTNTNNCVVNTQQKSQDAKIETTVKVGGRVRIKLGTNKQQPSGKQNNHLNNETNTNTKSTNEVSAVKSKSCNTSNHKSVENINEDSTSSFGHLRRITRRSQRAIQSIINEDDESISSMTSTDENQNTNNNQANSDIITTQDSEQSNQATPTSAAASATASSATNGSSNVDTPRRYKRRKVETSESQSIDCDNLLESQNYKLPNHNSFELFKNIRKQVDKRLKNLNNVSPKIPHGFKDYMLSKGTYLLEGNKLGNGTNLYLNEDGGLNSAPMGKYRVFRQSKMNYSVPNRAKVPLGLPVNSPLYDLFVEQEKERYRMRIQHIKEREKLTLAVEQEIMRVHNQAALFVAEQTEPFSACTMLKHQEIYNYMDSDGVNILSREDVQQDQVQPEGVRTRRRQHGQISPVRRPSEGGESNSLEPTRKSPGIGVINADNQKNEVDKQQALTISEPNESSDETKDTKLCDIKSVYEDNDQPADPPVVNKIQSDDTSSNNSQSDKAKSGDDTKSGIDDKTTTCEKTSKLEIKTEAVSPVATFDLPESVNSDQIQKEPIKEEEAITSNLEKPTSPAVITETNAVTDQVVSQAENQGESQASEQESSITDEEKKVQNKELFLKHLQDIDDKWERIRNEMLIRHRNEAESLHAIQKLEWEWKTKEIGACDVRTTLNIDNSLVPRLIIQVQDY